MLDQLEKYLLYTNLKKYKFHQDEVRFLGYIISYQDIQIKKIQIKVICNWPEPESVYNI